MSDPALPRHWRKLYENKYLGAWNLFNDKTGQYGEAAVKIASVRQELVTGEGGRKEQCTVLRFVGKTTPMILTKRQGKNLERVHGPDPNQWVGKEIKLWAEERKVKGEMCRVLSIKSRSVRAGEMKEELQDRTVSPPESFGDEEPTGERQPGED